jgi:hypothetical protein
MRLGLSCIADLGRLLFTRSWLIAAPLGPAGYQEVQRRDYQQYRDSGYDEVHRESPLMVPLEKQEGYDPKD